MSVWCESATIWWHWIIEAVSLHKMSDTQCPGNPKSKQLHHMSYNHAWQSAIFVWILCKCGLDVTGSSLCLFQAARVFLSVGPCITCLYVTRGYQCVCVCLSGTPYLVYEVSVSNQSTVSQFSPTSQFLWPSPFLGNGVWTSQMYNPAPPMRIYNLCTQNNGQLRTQYNKRTTTKICLSGCLWA